MMQVRCLSTAIIFLSVTGFVRAQPRDLREDLAQLDVRHSTEHYSLAGTVSTERLAEYGRALEYIYAEYAAGFGELVNMQPAKKPESETRRSSNKTSGQNKSKRLPETDPNTNHRSSQGGDTTNGETKHRFKVVVFDSEQTYGEFTAAYFGGSAEHTRGLHVPDHELLVILDEADSDEPYEVLFHEAFHQFMQRYIAFAPIWINEGLATYYGTARVSAEGLVFDRPQTDFRFIVSAAADAGMLIPFDELMLSDRDAFYDRQPVPNVSFEHRALAYGQAYTLVDYMLSDAGGRNHLRAYLRKLAVSNSDAQSQKITRDHFPPNLLADMVEPWMKTVRK